MFEPGQAKLVGLSLGIMNGGGLALDVDCVSSIKALKERLNTMFPEWDGQETLCDMVEWLHAELRTVESKFMERYQHETVHLS